MRNLEMPNQTRWSRECRARRQRFYRRFLPHTGQSRGQSSLRMVVRRSAPPVSLIQRPHGAGSPSSTDVISHSGKTRSQSIGKAGNRSSLQRRQHETQPVITPADGSVVRNEATSRSGAMIGCAALPESQIL
jgi:hypothetical protein